MEQNLSHTISLLTRFPSSLSALLLDLPEAWTAPNEGENTWSVFDIVAHLVHVERTDWMPRANIVLEFGETRTFPPLDRTAHLRENRDTSLPRLLHEFSRLRAENLSNLQARELQPTDLERLGRHPALGSVTLSQLLAAWAVHDLTHLHQISRVMAHQYAGAVGPWSRYLGVLRCSGHSDR
jgi:hypothetical protein